MVTYMLSFPEMPPWEMTICKTSQNHNKSFLWGSKYARGLVVLNKINKDRIAHLWWGITVIANSLIYVISNNDIFWIGWSV